MKNVSILVAQPESDFKIASDHILKQVQLQIEDVKIRDLSSLYPNFEIDQEKEWAFLNESDVLVLHFPLLNYGPPAILKLWMDSVFNSMPALMESKGSRAQKIVLPNVMIGGSEAECRERDLDLEKALYSIEKTCTEMGFDFRTPVASYGLKQLPSHFTDTSTLQLAASDLSAQLIPQLKSAKGINAKEKIDQFIKTWFEQFSELKGPDHFLPHLSPFVKIVIPEGEFIGHSGFMECYNEVREFIEPGINYLISDVAIEELLNDYQVCLKVHYQLQGKSGKVMDSMVREAWRVQLLQGDMVRISEYLVEPE